MQELQELKCPICFNRYNETNHCPTPLGCGHTVCLTCYKTTTQSSSFRCPFCRTYLQRQGSTLSRNMPLLTIVRKHLMFGECSKHENMPLRFLCEKDKQQICEECLRNGDHKGHKVKDVGPLKRELEMKAKVLEEKEANFIQYQKKLESTPEKRKHEDLVSLTKMFDELESLVKKRKLEVASKIAVTCEHQKNILSNAFVKKSKGRKLLKQKAKEYKQETQTNDNDQIPLQFDKQAAEQRINEFSKVPDNLCKSIADSLKEQTLKIASSIDFSQEELMLGNELYDIVPFKTISRLRFIAQNDTLIIELGLIETNDCLLEVEAWEDIRCVEFRFTKLQFDENDLSALEYVMNKLDKMQAVRIIQTLEEDMCQYGEEEYRRDQDTIGVANELVKILFSKAQRHLEHIKLELRSINQGIDIIVSVLYDILPNIKAKLLKEFYLYFEQKVSPAYSSDLRRNLLLFSETLECLSLELPRTQLQNDLLHLTLPKLAYFKMELNCNRVDNTENTTRFLIFSLKSMKCLNTLDIRLYSHTLVNRDISNLFAQFAEMNTLKDLSFKVSPEECSSVMPDDVDFRSRLCLVMVSVSKSLLKMNFLSSLCLGFGLGSIDYHEIFSGSEIKGFVSECRARCRARQSKQK